MPTPIKAVWFDFMGTCLNWHSSITSALPPNLSESQKSTFALELRQAYFDYNAQRLREGLPVENFDITQRKNLDAFLERSQNTDLAHLFTAEVKEKLVEAWHRQPAWPEMQSTLRKLKQNTDLEIYVHANGSTRLQLDLCKSAGLKFDLLFSSELVGLYKPAPESYAKVLEILKFKPEEVAMVACHAYDLRGAKEVGMPTVYVYRWTDDIREDQESVKKEFDVYLSDLTDLDSVVANM